MADASSYFFGERYRGLDLLQRLPSALRNSVEAAVAELRKEGAHPETTWDTFSQELLLWVDAEVRDAYLARSIKFPFYHAAGEDKFWRSQRTQSPFIERLAEQYPHVGIDLLEQLWIERGRGMPSALPGPLDQRIRWRSTASMTPGALALPVNAGPYAAVIVTPRCGIGGSEKVMREMIASMERLTGLPSFMIVADTEVPPEQLPSDSICLPNLTYRGEPYLRTATPARATALRDLILQVDASRVIVINSFSGNALLMDGALQKAGMKVASAMFCEAIGPGGAIEGYIQIADWLIDAGVTLFTDNHHIARMMSDLSFYDDTVVLSMPEPVTREPPPQGSRVLWAGRIDSQKRPDLLLEIARASPDITYEVWGVTLLSDDSIMDGILAQPNIVFRGPFDGFGSIDKSTVGALLYTSAYDGTPNLLLEAMARGLATVSSAVGGIPDLMADGRGLLVSPDAPAQAYISKLRALLTDTTAREAMVERSRDYIRLQRTQDIFDESVARLLLKL